MRILGIGFFVAAMIGMAVPFSAVAATSDVVIFEILFNPTGADAGFEYVVIENRGGADANLSGWQLYPDGIGYFTFPSFTIGAGKNVKIHLQVLGNADSENLYHKPDTNTVKNMGNTSGSVALFSSSDHNESSIVDFVQWGRVGETVGETWESTAEKAVLWTKGEFVAVDPAIEGEVLKRKSSGTGSSAWEVVASAIVPESQTSPTPTPSALADGGKVYSGPTIVPTIKAYAGKDMRGVAGGEIRFEGKALGWEDDLLDGPHIRFLWNFGDGALKEGRRVNHIYRYPGAYMATLMVTSGEDSARDDISVNISENPVEISEMRVGTDGWIELSNPSQSAVDISGWILGLSPEKKFTFPDGTTLASQSFSVYASDTLGFPIPEKDLRVVLFYPNGVVARELSFQNSVPLDQSLAFIDGALAITMPTPGVKNKKSVLPSATPAIQTAKIISSPVPLLARNNMPEETPPPSSPVVQEAATKETNVEEIPMAQLFQSNMIWLLGSVLVGAVSGGAILFVRRARKEDV